MFLIKAAFWLSLVILLLPSGTDVSDAGQSEPASPGVSASAAMFAARDTIADLSSFCQRNPATCETGSAAIQVFGQKAQHGAKLLYTYLADPDGSAELDQGTRAIEPGSDTLRVEDLDVPWQGPDSTG